MAAHSALQSHAGFWGIHAPSGKLPQPHTLPGQHSQHMSKGIGAGWCSFYPSKSKHAVLGTNIQHTVEGTMCPAECRIKSYNCNSSIGGADARLIYTPTLTWTVAEYLHSSPELIFSPDIEQKQNWTTFFAFMYNISLENTVLTLCAESFPHRSQIVLFCRTNLKMLNF